MNNEQKDGDQTSAREAKKAGLLYKIATRNEVQPAMLDIRSIARDSVALPYAYLEMIQFNPSKALVLTFTTCEVRIIGRNLAELYAGLLTHSVFHIQEKNVRYERDVPEHAPFISRIEIILTAENVELITQAFNPEREAVQTFEKQPLGYRTTEGSETTA